MPDLTEIIPASSAGTLNIHGLDDETKAVVGFLTRYANPKTRDAYERDLKHYRAYLTGQLRVLTMLHATRTDINMYLLHMQQRKLAEATIGRRFGTVRTFYKYAIIDELIEKDPTVHIEAPKIDHDKQRRTWLTTLQFSQLLNYARQSSPRDHAMIVSMGMLGLRIGEMCALDVTDVHRLIGAAEIRFVGKGSKYAAIDLPLEVLHAYDTCAGGRTEGPLFLSQYGTRWTSVDARRRLAVLVRHAGLKNVKITPHGLRRTAARTLQERGVELGAIQKFLRHADPRTTSTCYIGEGGGAASLARVTLANIFGQMSA